MLKGGQYNFIFRRLGKKIHSFRKDAKLTQEDLAFEAETSPTHISALELGKARPSIVMLYKIGKVLNVDLKDFFS